jgi:hypothetical protein
MPPRNARRNRAERFKDRFSWPRETPRKKLSLSPLGITSDLEGVMTASRSFAARHRRQAPGFQPDFGVLSDQKINDPGAKAAPRVKCRIADPPCGAC